MSCSRLCYCQSNIISLHSVHMSCRKFPGLTAKVVALSLKNPFLDLFAMPFFKWLCVFRLLFLDHFFVVVSFIIVTALCFFAISLFNCYPRSYSCTYFENLRVDFHDNLHYLSTAKVRIHRLQHKNTAGGHRPPKNHFIS